MVFTTRLYYNRQRKDSVTTVQLKNKQFDQECALEKNRKFLQSQENSKRAMKKLFFVSCICLFFMVCEFIGGLMSHSLAIMVDAAHMFSDVAGFMISFFAIYISQRKQTFESSYGYHRAEILGPMLSIFVIWGLLVWLNIEAIKRVIDPPTNINADVMLVTSIVGLICNIVNFCALNCACGSDPAEIAETEHVSESEHDDWTVEGKSTMHQKKPHLALTQVLLGVYVPRQAHMCIMKQSQSKVSRVEHELDKIDNDNEEDLEKGSINSASKNNDAIYNSANGQKRKFSLQEQRTNNILKDTHI